MKNYRDLFDGLDVEIPLLDGRKTKYINFDNAASTPAIKASQNALNEFLNFYSSVHRGTGYKSQLSTHVYEEARKTIFKFVGADPETHNVAFVKNTTEALNKLANRFPFTKERNIVLTSAMEHHSNDLPWRKVTEVVYINLLEDGRLDLADFEDKLGKYADRIALVSITGGSNVTGFINPYYEIAEKAHSIGAQICVDCAQLSPHRAVDMLPLDDPRHLDYVSISAHKLYSPFGSGALIGRKDTFMQGNPDMVGGGVVDIVTLDEVHWTGLPDKEEAGSPNHVGAIAFAASVKKLMSIGYDNIARHEAELTKYALKKLKDVKWMLIYGDDDEENTANRLGVIPFSIDGINHFKVASILGHEFGIGVRNGCFCAHPLILHLLDFSEAKAKEFMKETLTGNNANRPGLIRMSFGIYNVKEEIDIFIEALHKITAGEFFGDYVQDSATGEFHPKGWNPEFDKNFSLEDYE
jgi:cysteine desulfurase/selenocysteine lyase